MPLQTDNLIKNTELMKGLIQELAQDSPFGVFLDENPDCLNVYHDYSLYNMKETLSIRCKDFAIQSEINSVARYWGVREIVDYVLKPMVDQLSDWVNKSIPLKMTNNYEDEEPTSDIWLNPIYEISGSEIKAIKMGMKGKLKGLEKIREVKKQAPEEPKKKLHHYF